MLNSELGQQPQSSQHLFSTSSINESILEQSSPGAGQMHIRQDDIISLEAHDEVNRRSFGYYFYYLEIIIQIIFYFYVNFCF